jgi:hypothetical protein
MEKSEEQAMRIWDLSPKVLCRAHLLGEHRELHAIWTVLTQNRKGYSLHPETVRWRGKLRALYNRHSELVEEMEARGYKHASPLDRKLAKGSQVQNIFVDSKARQKIILREKPCTCFMK